MTDREYREWLVTEIITDRKAWCKRNKETRETLNKKPLRIIEKIYDNAK